MAEETVHAEERPRTEEILHSVELEHEEYTFAWPEDSTLLAAMLEADIPAPHSCTMGECGACMCVVEGGASYMDHNAVLSAADIKEDQRLACQTRRDDAGPYDISYLW